MERRSFLGFTGSGLFTVAGSCLSNSDNEHETAGNDDELIEKDAVELVPDSDEIGQGDWERTQDHSRDDTSEHVRDFARTDADDQLRTSAFVFSSVDGAVDHFETEPRYNEEDPSFEEHGIGSEAIFYDGSGGPWVSFRDANAVGVVLHMADEDGDKEFVLATGATMHETWR